MSTNPTNKKLAFELSVIGNAQTIKDIAEVKAAIADLNKQIKEAQKNGDQVKFDSLNIEMEKLKKTSSILRQELKQQQKDFEISKYPTDSLKALESQYGKLTKSIRALSEEERASAFGKFQLSNAKQLNDKINEISQSFGDNSKNIGNYAESIKKAFAGPFEFIKSVGLTAILFELGEQFVKIGEKALKAYEKTAEGEKKVKLLKDELAQLGAIGVSALASLIAPMVDISDQKLPKIIKKVNEWVSIGVGAVSGYTQLIKNIGNDVEIFFNKISIVKAKFDLFLKRGDSDIAKQEREQLTQKIKDLTLQNNRLAEYNILNKPEDAFNIAKEKQLKAGEEAAANAIIEEKNKKEKKNKEDQLTILEELKRTETEINKIIDDKVAKGQEYKQEQEDQYNIALKILEIETKIKNEKEAYARAQQIANFNASNASTLSTNVNTIKSDGKVDKSSTLNADGSTNDQAIIERVKHQAQVTENLQNQIDEKNRISKNIHDQEEKDQSEKLALEIADAELSAFRNFLAAKLELQGQYNLKQRDEAIQALNEEYYKKERFARGNAELIKRLEKEKADKAEEINKDFAKKEQKRAIGLAIINGALAALKVVAKTGDPSQAISIALETALAVILIKAQKFNKGGFTGKGSSLTDSTGQRVAGIVHQDEYVAPKHQVQRYPRLFQALNQDRTDKGSFVYRYSYDRGSMNKKYAEGGFTTPYLSQNLRNSLLENSSTLPADIKLVMQDATMNMAGMVYKAIKQGIEEHLPNALASGLSDAHRRNERDQNLQKKLSQ